MDNMKKEMHKHLAKAYEFLKKNSHEAALVRLGLAEACAEESGSELPPKYFEIKKAACGAAVEKALYKAERAAGARLPLHEITLRILEENLDAARCLAQEGGIELTEKYREMRNDLDARRTLSCLARYAKN